MGLSRIKDVAISDLFPLPASRSSPQAAGVRTKAGAWAVSDAEAKLIEHLVDGDEKWDKLMAGRQDWVNRPIQPPGLGRTGVAV